MAGLSVRLSVPSVALAPSASSCLHRRGAEEQPTIVKQFIWLVDILSVSSHEPAAAPSPGRAPADRIQGPSVAAFTWEHTVGFVSV